MGCDHQFYLLSASKYVKLLRPMYRNLYGRVSYQSIILEQYKKIQFASVINDIQNDIYPTKRLLLGMKKQEIGPIKAYYQEKQDQCPYSEEIRQQIDQFLTQNAEKIDDTRNHFLRMEQTLRQMDLFTRQGFRIKVSNILQVENFLNFIQIAKEALKNYDGKWQNEYQGVDQAHQIFSEVLAKMQKSEEQLYLIFVSIN